MMTPATAKRVIVLDPGHGGRDPGACYADVREGDMALSLSRAFKPILEAAGFAVFLTRNADADMMGEELRKEGQTPEEHRKAWNIMKYRDLKARCNYANYLKAGAFLSFHLDAPPASVVKRSNPSGNTAIYAQGSGQGFRLASVLYAAILPLPQVDRGVRSDIAIADHPIRVLRDTAMPAALLELGFVTNDADRAWLSDPANQATMGQCVADGLLAYFEA